MITLSPLRVLKGLAFLLAVAFGFFLLQINILLQPVDIPAMAQQPIPVSISSGSSSLHIATTLQEAGLVRNALVFRYWAKYRGLDQKLQAGNYLLSYGLTMDEILAELVAGNVYRPTVSVTVPEGFTLDQIASRVAAAGLVEYDEFMELALQAVPALGRSIPGQRYALEGFLFPDTYEFDEGVSAEAMLERMQARFEEVFDGTMRERAEELGLDLHQVVTMASLVEREAQVAAERELVAAVLHNRLKKKMLLQVDATVIYALGEHKNKVLLKDLEINSPYNTYKFTGLPPGPIAAPGRKALLAVLYPADADYLYYVAKNDGSGEHYFARTFAEHQANIRKAPNR
jgi:UPF0755 protein